MTSVLRRPLVAASVAFMIPLAAFAESERPPSACKGPLDAERAVRCALAQSPEVASARHELDALSGRRLTASAHLPSHPELTGTLARRTGVGDAGDESALNWGVALAQEIELSGERAARLDEIDAERTAAVRTLAAVERDTAAATLTALYVLGASEEALALSADLERGATTLASAMAARAAEGLIPPVEADLAAAEVIRLSLTRAEAETRRSAARAHLAALLGFPGGPHLPALVAAIGGAVEAPPPIVDVLLAKAFAARADLAAAGAERLAARARIERVRRERIPNLVLSIFAQRDGIDERVLGGGLTIPLFLPSPLGPSGEGEIRAAEANRQQAEQRLEAVRRRVREEVERGLGEWQGRRAALDVYPSALVERARAHVVSLAEAVKDRQLSPREALLAQRTFIELLQGLVEARLAEAVARIELGRAAGLPLPGVTP